MKKINGRDNYHMRTLVPCLWKPDEKAQLELKTLAHRNSQLRSLRAGSVIFLRKLRDIRGLET